MEAHMLPSTPNRKGILTSKEALNCLKKKKIEEIGTIFSGISPASNDHDFPYFSRGARWLSGRVSDSGARGPGFETFRRRVVSLSKTLYSPKVLVNYPGSDGSVPI